ncbi:MAG: Rne/Rng family ribonuclease [Candidatus Omnitrophota bacterium]|nr:Rne/Rng family ribonuclease [Candidatus Omnitrophota bacterium]MDZ4242554.1 Rne/Rng family ribonuclease [Candidatus Omnitrophota bacterium]
MSREILFHVGDGEKRVAILEDGKLDNFLIETEHRQSILGNVYKGRVESILPSINGAFVNIGQERNGFLYLTDAVNPLVADDLANKPKHFLKRFFNRPDRKEGEKKEGEPQQQHQRHHHRREENKPLPLTVGQEILVQVVKDPFSNKGARLTTHISLAGRFVVFMPYDQHHGVSRKIESSEERHRLKEVLRELNFTKTGGFIVRTVSQDQGKKELLRDAKFLYKIWQQIQALSEQKQAPALIYKEYDLVWRVVRDYLTEKVDKLVIDSQDDFLRVRKSVENLIGSHLVEKIIHYKGNASLFDSKNISSELETIYDTKIMLKSGAYLVIEPTEGLTVVDVNSGKFKTKASPEDAAFMVNMEAAPEIARQLRLRDVGGIIVIDFIDMSREGHKRKVLEALQNALSKDRAKTEVNRISALGLVEMTRARTGNTLDAISFVPCPYCDGRGRVRLGVSHLPVAQEHKPQAPSQEHRSS